MNIQAVPRDRAGRQVLYIGNIQRHRAAPDPLKAFAVRIFQAPADNDAQFWVWVRCLCVAISLVRSGQVDADEAFGAFVDWARRYFYCLPVDERPDVAGLVRNCLKAFKRATRKAGGVS